jgi:hypothetical protein
MALTIELLDEYKKVQKDMRLGLNDDECLYLNYLFFYLIHDRISARYIKDNDSLLLVNPCGDVKQSVQVSNLEVVTVREETALYRRDSLFKRMERIPITKQRKLDMLTLLQKNSDALLVSSKAKVNRMFLNHKRNISK